MRQGNCSTPFSVCKWLLSKFRDITLRHGPYSRLNSFIPFSIMSVSNYKYHIEMCVSFSYWINPTSVFAAVPPFSRQSNFISIYHTRVNEKETMMVNCCKCNRTGQCRNCACVKAGKCCDTCLPSRLGQNAKMELL